MQVHKDSWYSAHVQSENARDVIEGWKECRLSLDERFLVSLDEYHDSSSIRYESFLTIVRLSDITFDEEVEKL